MSTQLGHNGRDEAMPWTDVPNGYNDVLALVTSSEPWSPAALAGVDIAAMFGANVTGCYVNPSLRSLRGVDDEPTVMSLLMDAPRAYSEDSDAFKAFAHTRGARHAAWVCTQVSPAKTMRSLGAWHDLIVVERDLAEPSVLIDVLGECLMTCRSACLIVPPHWARPLRFNRVAIGWNGSIEAVRAVHAALPLLKAADHVTVLRDGALALKSEDVQPPPFDPTLYLRSHGVKVSERPVYANPLGAGKVMLGDAMRQSADCLVMGAYGHARVRERVLGGATRYILEQADIPVLMQH